MFFPATDDGPLGLASSRQTGSHSFSVPDLLAITAGGLVLADNTDPTKRAEFITVASDVEQIRVVGSKGQDIPLPSHGLGSAGQVLWLGTAGGIVTAAPAAAVVQPVAIVIDSDNLHLLFEPSAFQVTYAFGGDMSVLGEYAIANGNPDSISQASGSLTRVPIAADGDIISFAYQVQAGDIATQIKIWVDGILKATVILNSILFVNTDVKTLTPIPVTTGSYVEIEYDAGAAMNNSVFLLSQTA